jgi:hypothetical protein
MALLSATLGKKMALSSGLQKPDKEGAVVFEQRWRWLSHKKILRKDGAGIDFTKIMS